MPYIVFIITLIFGYIIRKIIFLRLTRWSKNTKTKIDDIIVDSIKGPFIIWFLMLGLFFALESSGLPENLTHIINKALLVLGVFSVTFVLANVSSKLIKIYSQKVEKVTIEVAREAMKEVAGGVPEFEPFIRYNTFADFRCGFFNSLLAYTHPRTC